MAVFDATKKSDNSNLSQIEILKNRGLFVEGDDLVAVKGKIEVRLVGTFVLNNKGKVVDGKLQEIIVEKEGNVLYEIREIDRDPVGFFKAIKKGEFHTYLEKKIFGEKDQILGSNFDDKLHGFNRNDKINGYNGDDQINGGKGNDKLWGDVGDDAFIFNKKLSATKNVDTIKDWDLLKNNGGGTDTIWLDTKIFKAFAGMEGDGIAKKNFGTGKNAKTETSTWSTTRTRRSSSTIPTGAATRRRSSSSSSTRTRTSPTTIS